MDTTIQSGAAPTARATLSRDVPGYGVAGTRDAVPTQAILPEAVQPAAATPPPAMNTEAAKQVARQINDFLKMSSAANVEVSVDDESGQIVMRVVDNATKQVLRQIPSEEMLAIAKSIDVMRGVLLQQKAG